MHLLNERSGTNGSLWGAITVRGFPRFTRQDVAREIQKAREMREAVWRGGTIPHVESRIESQPPRATKARDLHAWWEFWNWM